jgi:hypothetical protein
MVLLVLTPSSTPSYNALSVGNCDGLAHSALRAPLPRGDCPVSPPREGIKGWVHPGPRESEIFWYGIREQEAYASERHLSQCRQTRPAKRRLDHHPRSLSAQKLARGKNLFVDLGAERLIAAERGIEKIAIEVKSFRSASDMKDLEDAVGQFVLYDHLLTRYDPERVLYLAVPEAVRASIFEEEAGAVLIEDRVLRLFTFSPNQEVIVQWIPQTPP